MNSDVLNESHITKCIQNYVTGNRTSLALSVVLPSLNIYILFSFHCFHLTEIFWTCYPHCNLHYAETRRAWTQISKESTVQSEMIKPFLLIVVKLQVFCYIWIVFGSNPLIIRAIFLCLKALHSSWCKKLHYKTLKCNITNSLCLC